MIPTRDTTECRSLWVSDCIMQKESRECSLFFLLSFPFLFFLFLFFGFLSFAYYLCLLVFCGIAIPRHPWAIELTFARQRLLSFVSSTLSHTQLCARFFSYVSLDLIKNTRAARRSPPILYRLLTLCYLFVLPFVSFFFFPLLVRSVLFPPLLAL